MIGNIPLMTRYIYFEEIGNTSKTTIWNVISQSSGITLGQVKWYGAWRQYCFFPESNTIWNTSCLESIQSFIKAEMEARKNEGSEKSRA
jgi:hypothetical protein